MNRVKDWPVNVPLNIQDRQIWVVSFTKEVRDPFYSRTVHPALVAVVRPGPSWGRPTTFGFVRSKLSHGMLKKGLEREDILENMRWLLTNPMRPGDWSGNLAQHNRRKLTWFEPIDFTL